MIPISLMPDIKDLILLAHDDLSQDARLQNIWAEEATAVAREHDVIVTEITLTAVVGQAIYSLPAASTRLLSVMFDNKTLGYTESGTLALTTPDFINAANGTPRLWGINAISSGLDSPAPTITSREFFVFPPPATATATSLKVLVVTDNDSLMPDWMHPWMSYRVAARACRESPEVNQPGKAEWFGKLSELWSKLVESRLQI